MTDLARGHQAEQRPGGLRRGAGSLLITAIVELVARGVLAPAAIGILDLREPSDRLAEFRRGVIDASGVEGAQDRPGAIDVVHAPAAVPTALLELGAAQIVDSTRHRRAIRLADLRQHRDTAGGDV